MDKVIAINIEKCLACRSCEIACAVVHSESKVLQEAIQESPKPQRMVTVETAGAFERRVGTPFADASDSCIGFDACVAVCPTGHIVSVDKGPVRELETWSTKLDMVRCEICGNAYIPVKEFEYIQARLGEQIVLEKICSMCRRTKTASRLEAATTSK